MKRGSARGPTGADREPPGRCSVVGRGRFDAESGLPRSARSLLSPASVTHGFGVAGVIALGHPEGCAARCGVSGCSRSRQKNPFQSLYLQRTGRRRKRCRRTLRITGGSDLQASAMDGCRLPGGAGRARVSRLSRSADPAVAEHRPLVVHQPDVQRRLADQVLGERAAPSLGQATQMPPGRAMARARAGSRDSSSWRSRVKNRYVQPGLGGDEELHARPGSGLSRCTKPGGGLMTETFEPARMPSTPAEEHHRGSLPTGKPRTPAAVGRHGATWTSVHLRRPGARGGTRRRSLHRLARALCHGLDGAVGAGCAPSRRARAAWPRRRRGLAEERRPARVPRRPGERPTRSMERSSTTPSRGAPGRPARRAPSPRAPGCLLQLAAGLLAGDQEVGLLRHAARHLPPAPLHLLLRLLAGHRGQGAGEDHRLPGEGPRPWRPRGAGATPGGEQRLDAFAGSAARRRRRRSPWPSRAPRP